MSLILSRLFSFRSRPWQSWTTYFAHVFGNLQIEMDGGNTYTLELFVLRSCQSIVLYGKTHCKIDCLNRHMGLKLQYHFHQFVCTSKWFVLLTDMQHVACAWCLVIASKRHIWSGNKTGQQIKQVETTNKKHLM